MTVEIDDEISEILKLKNIAVVGCSSTPGKDAHGVPKYLLDHGYNIIPVNPNREKIFNIKSYSSLRDIDKKIDVVDVFRPSEEVSGIVDDILRRKDVKVLWLQLGIHDEKAVKKAENTGIHVVQDRCIRSEHKRFI